MKYVKLTNKIIKNKRTFNLVEFKLLIYITHNLQQDLLKDKLQKDLLQDIVLYLNTKDIYKKFNINYLQLKRSLEMLTKPLKIEEDNKKTKFLGLIQNRYIFYKQTNELEITIYKELLPFFKYIKENYSYVNKELIYNITYKHNLKLYPLLNQVKNMKHKSIILTLEQLNNMFNTNYKNFNTLNNNILKKNINELNLLLQWHKENYKIEYEKLHNKETNKFDRVVFRSIEVKRKNKK